MRQAAGKDSEILEATTINELIIELKAKYKVDADHFMFAIAQEYTREYDLVIPLEEEVAIIPPVSGG